MKDQIRARATLLGILLTELKTVLRFPAYDVPSVTAVTAEDIEKAAEACRLHWNLDLHAPIMQVGRVLERAGVVVVQGIEEITKIDAFSRYGENVLIFMNQGASTRASRWHFDLAHELGHLVLHRNLPTGSPETEAAADMFASAFLLPRTAYGREFRTRKFTWQHLFELKRRWGVSLAALVKRAHDLGLLDDAEYRRAFQYMSYKRWRTEGEPFEPDFQRPELLSNALSSLGKTLKKTLPELCEEMQVSPSLFVRIAGFSLPENPKARVLSFPTKRSIA